jgi:hypothetical protein
MSNSSWVTEADIDEAIGIGPGMEAELDAISTALPPPKETPRVGFRTGFDSPPAPTPAATPAAKSSRTAERKWGSDVMSLGFCITPSLLLKAQKRLRLTPSQLVVLLHLMDIWWGDENNLPWPSKRHLAERIGMGERRVQAIMAELEVAGLAKRVERRDRFGGKTSNAYDLGGLVKRLNELAPSFLDAEATVKRVRREAALPGTRSRRTAVE